MSREAIINVRVDAQFKDKVQETARERDETVSAAIRNFLEAYVRNPEPDEG